MLSMMKTKPFNHQLVDFERSKDMESFGVWWEQGTGKCKLMIDTGCYLFLNRKITGILVIAPNYVHSNWLSQEFPIHSWANVEYEGVVYRTEKAGTIRLQEQLIDVCIPSISRLAVLVMSYSSIRTDKGFETAHKFLKAHRTLMILDESTAIAEPGSKITKKIHLLGPLAEYRRALSGTPIAEGAFKIYSAVKWLQKDFWKKRGMDSYFIFKQRYGVFKMGWGAGKQFQQLVDYKNLPELRDYISVISSRVLKEEALDLPPKIYSKLEFELTEKQMKMYNTLKEELAAELDENHTIEAKTALIKIMRLQQIASGFAVTQEYPPISVGDIVVYQKSSGVINGEIIEIFDDRIRIRGSSMVNTDSLNIISKEEDVWIENSDERLFRIAAAEQKTINLFPNGDNPRLQCLLSFLETISHKVIIWARFRGDIDLIYSALSDRAVRFDGMVSAKDREIALERFRNDPNVKIFVANPQAISMGVTLIQAKTVVYYSNSFALEKRLQSEDRAHRIGQDVAVNIVDMVAKDTVDVHITNTLRKKFDVAGVIMGDRLREWIS